MSKTVEELEKELAAANAKLEEAEEQLGAAATAGQINPLVPGKVTIKVETPKGGKSTKTIGFRDNRHNVRLASGVIVPSALLLKTANGTLSEEEAAAVPPLKELGKEGAIDWLTTLFTRGASNIVEK